MYTKILVPLDGSKFSECGLQHAKAIATGCSVPNIVLLEVVEPIDTQLYELPDEEFRRNLLKKAEDEAKKYLSKVADDLKKEGLSASFTVLRGSPADAIMDYVNKNKVDLIIMSTHGRSGVSRWTFGSVADRVIREAKIPVLVAAPPGCRLGG